MNIRPLALPLGCCALFELSAFLFQINMTHYIKHLSFGRDYPGIVNPLDGTDVTAQQGKSQLREIFLRVGINESWERSEILSLKQEPWQCCRRLGSLHLVLLLQRILPFIRSKSPECFVLIL